MKPRSLDGSHAIQSALACCISYIVYVWAFGSLTEDQNHLKPGSLFYAFAGDQSSRHHT
jgi:hypothetical protein